MIQSSKSLQKKICTQEDQNELLRCIPEKPCHENSENAQRCKDGRIKRSNKPAVQSLTKSNASEYFVYFLRLGVVQV